MWWPRVGVERTRWTKRIGAGDVGVAAAIHVMLELIVEAGPVHPLEGLVQIAVALDRPTAADANREAVRLEHMRIVRAQRRFGARAMLLCLSSRQWRSVFE